MRLIAEGTNQVIHEADNYEVGQRVRVAMTARPEASPLFSEAFPDRPLMVEWEVVAVDMTRGVATARLLDAKEA